LTVKFLYEETNLVCFSGFLSDFYRKHALPDEFSTPNSLLVDGVPMKSSHGRFETDAILKENGIPFSDIDRIFPRLNYWMTENYLLRVDHPSTVELMRQDEQISFISYENIAGNILLSGGVKLFPGDKILWNQTEIQADSLIGMESNIQLSITSQNFSNGSRFMGYPQIRYSRR
jgi:hypothetical protein